ncbi:DUF6344 domain-containing protein [Streptomyces sp. NPDC052052]|uniref:DUF6344 domain-containing protein n=1 Tax=Streptomyces sp. NPDC052052 TaxID=3154756 RepID=UPI00342C06C1
MSTFKPRNIWTAFVTALFALLAALGFMSAPAAATEASTTEPSTTNQEHTGAAPVTASTPSVRWTLPRDRALPPTMKQRIRAEAHGSSPVTRHLSADTTDAAKTSGTTRAAHGARAGDGSLLPP